MADCECPRAWVESSLADELPLPSGAERMTIRQCPPEKFHSP